jgi:hypothetical protein
LLFVLRQVLVDLPRVRLELVQECWAGKPILQLAQNMVFNPGSHDVQMPSIFENLFLNQYLLVDFLDFGVLGGNTQYSFPLHNGVDEKVEVHRLLQGWVLLDHFLDFLELSFYAVVIKSFDHESQLLRCLYLLFLFLLFCRCFRLAVRDLHQGP